MATEKQKKQLGKYVNELKTEMWLNSWRIDIVWDDGIDEDSFGSIHPTYGQKHAELRLCHDFFSLPAWKQRRTLVHEFLHLYAADVQKLGEALRENLGDQAYNTWFHGFRLAVEHMVDSLTTMTAHEDSQFLPLPNFTERG